MVGMMCNSGIMEKASDEILAENVYLLPVNAKNMHGSDMNKPACSEETLNFVRAIKKSNNAFSKGAVSYRSIVTRLLT